MHEDGEYARSSRPLDVLQLATRIWVGKWWILLTAITCAGLFALVASIMTPIYRVSTVLVPAGQDKGGLGGALSSALGSFAGLASLVGGPGASPTSATDEALGVLRSRQFAERFIVERQLLPVLFNDKWDKKGGRWAVPPEQIPTIGQAVKVFYHDVMSIAQDRKTNLYTLQVEWTDRNVAADWTNDLVRRLNSEMRSRAIKTAEDSLAFLRKELDSTSVVETRQSINSLIEVQINNRMLSNVTEEYAFRVVDKAYAPDLGDVARPKKRLMIAFGLFVGLLLGSFVVVFRGLLRDAAKQRV